jgi:hypothetical protein
LKVRAAVIGANVELLKQKAPLKMAMWEKRDTWFMKTFAQ